MALRRAVSTWMRSLMRRNEGFMFRRRETKPASKKRSLRSTIGRTRISTGLYDRPLGPGKRIDYPHAPGELFDYED